MAGVTEDLEGQDVGGEGWGKAGGKGMGLGKGKGWGPYSEEPKKWDYDTFEGKTPHRSGFKKKDWQCPKCGNHNFATRIKCHSGGCNWLREGCKEGDWYCRTCRTHNYSTHIVCRGCDNDRDMHELMESVMTYGKGRGGGNTNAPWKKGDWECEKCGYHNWAKNFECAKCAGDVNDGWDGLGTLMQLMAKQGHKLAKGVGKNMKDGDWLCPGCGNHNWWMRISCNSCDMVQPGMKRGDWICRRCRHHNFRKHTTCCKCKSDISHSLPKGKGQDTAENGPFPAKEDGTAGDKPVDLPKPDPDADDDEGEA